MRFLIGLIVTIAIMFGFWKFISISFEWGEQSVSGIVYNTKNNKFISGNTSFSIRASENTYVSEENRSSYCLPPNSPYIELVNKASQDKDMKVIVTTKKHFTFKPNPWTCVANVSVEPLNK